MNQSNSSITKHVLSAQHVTQCKNKKTKQNAHKMHTNTLQIRILQQQKLNRRSAGWTAAELGRCRQRTSRPVTSENCSHIQRRYIWYIGILVKHNMRAKKHVHHSTQPTPTPTEQTIARLECRSTRGPDARHARVHSTCTAIMNCKSIVCIYVYSNCSTLWRSGTLRVVKRC